MLITFSEVQVLLTFSYTFPYTLLYTCSLPFCPKIKVECSAKQEEGACVDHECLWVCVKCGTVKLAHGNARS